MGRILVNAFDKLKANTATNKAVSPVISALIFSNRTKSEQRGHHAADEFDQAGADEVAHAFDVAHDARNQHAALVGIVIADRQPADVLLDFLAKFRNQTLSGFGKKLRESKRRDALNHGSARATVSTSGVSSAMLMFADHVIQQEPRGIGQHQAAHAVDDHQAESQRQQFAARQNHLAQVGPDFAEALGLLALGRCGLVS